MEALGPEILSIISGNLHIRDLLSLALVSKHLKDAVAPMIFQASSPCQIQAQEQIYALPVPGGCQLKELDLANLNSFGVDYGLAKWHKLTNDFLCSYKGLRIIKIVDSFAVLPLLISGIVNHGETLVLLNVSCGEPVASTLDMLGAGATDFAAALGQVKDKCTSLGSLTCNLDRSIYHGFGNNIEVTLRQFGKLEFLGIVTPKVTDDHQPIDLCHSMMGLEALAPRIRSPNLRSLKIEMGRKLRHEKLSPYGWARELQQKQTWDVYYCGSGLAFWETEQAALDMQLTKAIGTAYDPPADLCLREIWCKYVRQMWAMQTRFSKEEGPIPNWCRQV